MNKCTFIGNLSKEPELQTTGSGVSVAKFTIAVQRQFKNADGEREADFIPCVVWRNQAENLCKYCHKGDKIAVSGALQIRNFEAQDGSKRYVSEIIADEVEFLNIKRNEERPKPKKDEGFPF